MWKLLKIAITAKRILLKYPVTSNTVIFASFCVAAEATQQIFFQNETRKANVDITSINNYVIAATVTQGTPLTYWYKWLDGRYPGTTYKVICKKLFWDMGIANPIALAAFYIVLDVLENEDGIKNCKTKIIPTIASSTVFWIPAQAVNFLLIPPLFRVIYISVCSFAWVWPIIWPNRYLIIILNAVISITYLYESNPVLLPKRKKIELSVHLMYGASLLAILNFTARMFHRSHHNMRDPKDFVASYATPTYI